jgi:hypothetical protein
VALWNIERGLELDYIELFLTNKDAFMAKVEEERKDAKGHKKRVRSVELRKIPEEIEALKSADVWMARTLVNPQVREIAGQVSGVLGLDKCFFTLLSRAK